jgi:hypothetical protein
MTDLNTTTLDQLVRINELGNVANAVNFGMMDDPEQNRLLCESFVFNHDQNKPKTSTVGLLDTIRESFHSNNTPNIHLIVQQYGKGKSHFAVAVANFFHKPAASDEVQGILHQIENATSPNSPIVERLRAFKDDRRYLTLCLSGDRIVDLPKSLLSNLIATLEREGIQDSIAHQLCRTPLEYLENLSDSDRYQAERYLDSLGNPDGDLEAIKDLLRGNDTRMVRVVKDIVYQLVGLSPDFQANIDVSELLEDTLQRLCGDHKDAPFDGILILFDELLYYLQAWAQNPIGAGGTALQNITNLCELGQYKSKIALVGFAQQKLENSGVLSQSNLNEYKKLATRLDRPGCTYEPESSLELVFANLIVRHDTAIAQQFDTRWCKDTLLAECRTAFEKRIPSNYRDRGFTLERFFQTFGNGCYPLHPLTTYLLSRLDFAGHQDRTAIQFIKEHLGDFITTTTIEQNGRLNYLRPIAIIDFFSNTLQSALYYEAFRKAEQAIAGSDDPTLHPTLQALFLFYAAGDRIAKTDRDEHEPILAELSGLSAAQTKTALQNLKDSVFYKEASKLYSFYSGTKTPKELEADIEDAVRDSRINIHDLASHLQVRLGDNPANQRLSASDFVNAHQLVNDDWQFQSWVYSISDLKMAIQSTRQFDQLEESLSEQVKARWPKKNRPSTKGIFSYVIAPTQDDLNAFQHELTTLLASSKNGQRFVVAIPDRGVEGALTALTKKNVLQHLSSAEKQAYGDTYQQLLKQIEKDLDTYCSHCLNDLTYHSRAVLLDTTRNRPEDHASSLLKTLYPEVPPSVDKLRSNLASGTKIIKVIATELLKGQTIDSTIFPDQSYSNALDSAFVQYWQLFRKRGKTYELQEPKHPAIVRAWNVLEQHTALGERSQSTTLLKELWDVLSQPPYGYNELNFTVLTCAWLSYHAQEVSLRGPTALPKRRANAPVGTLSLPEWASSDVLDTASGFVHTWIEKHKAAIVRSEPIAVPEMPDSPMTYDVARDYLNTIDLYLENSEIPAQTRESLQLDRESVAPPFEAIKIWFAPVKRFEALVLNSGTVPPPDVEYLEQLIELRPHFDRQLPSIPFGHDAIYVSPTPDQRDRDKQATEAIDECIFAAFDTFCEQAEMIQTQEDFYAFADRARSLKSQFEARGEMFDTHLENVDYAIKKAEEKYDNLRNPGSSPVPPVQPPPPVPPSPPPAVLIDDRLDRDLDTIASGLHSNTTQANYHQLREELMAMLSRDDAEVTEVRRDRALSLLQKLDQDERELMRKLETWQQEIVTLSDRSQIGNLISDLSRHKDRYITSDDRQTVETLWSDVNTLLNFPFSNVEKLRELHEVDRVTGDLKSWYETHEVTRSSLQQHFQDLSTRLTAQRDRIKARHERTADSWLQLLQDKLTQVYAALSETERFSSTVDLLKCHKEERPQHEPYLKPDQIQTLTQLVRQARIEQNKLTALQIELGFKKLPKVQRIELYEKLAQYLDHPDES